MERDVRRGRVVLCPGSFCNTTATWVRCGLFHSLQTSKLKSFLHMGHPRCLDVCLCKGGTLDALGPHKCPDFRGVSVLKIT